jgi:hypothetical protein
MSVVHKAGAMLVQVERLQQEATALKLDKDGLLRDASCLTIAIDELKASSKAHDWHDV